MQKANMDAMSYLIYVVVSDKIRYRKLRWGMYMLPEIFVFCKLNYLTLCSLA